MLIPGIPDADLMRLHWNYGGGRAAVGYRHVPSGILAARECQPDFPARHSYAAALAELERVLRERGFLPKGEVTGAGASPDSRGV
jgi:hypothetical protein